MSSLEPSEGPWTRYRLYVLLGILVFAFAQAGLYAGHGSGESNFPGNALSATPGSASTPAHRILGQHPIAKLMDEAEAKFRKLLSKQSQTLEAAVVEYKRRYRRDPPKGFDAWWKFAQENNVRMVDEYDGLMEDLEPFWQMTGAEFKRRAVQVRYFRGVAY